MLKIIEKKIKVPYDYKTYPGVEGAAWRFLEGYFNHKLERMITWRMPREGMKGMPDFYFVDELKKSFVELKINNDGWRKDQMLWYYAYEDADYFLCFIEIEFEEYNQEAWYSKDEKERLQQQ